MCFYFPKVQKQGSLSLLLAGSAELPCGRGEPWDPGVLAWSALPLVAGERQRSFLGAVLPSSSTLYFNNMLQSDIKQWGNI